MSYPQDLAFHLRLRNVQDAVVTDVVAEVEEYIATGGDPTEFFGPPDQYAARFPAGGRRRSRTVPIYLGAAAAIGWIVVTLVLYAGGTWDRTAATDRVVLLPALGLLALGLVVSFVVHTVSASRPVRPRR